MLHVDENTMYLKPPYIAGLEQKLLKPIAYSMF